MGRIDVTSVSKMSGDDGVIVIVSQEASVARLLFSRSEKVKAQRRC